MQSFSKLPDVRKWQNIMFWYVLESSYSILKMKFAISGIFPRLSLTTVKIFLTYFTNNSVVLLKQATIKLQMKNVTIIMQLLKNTDDI